MIRTITQWLNRLNLTDWCGMQLEAVQKRWICWFVMVNLARLIVAAISIHGRTISFLHIASRLVVRLGALDKPHFRMAKPSNCQCGIFKQPCFFTKGDRDSPRRIVSYYDIMHDIIIIMILYIHIHYVCIYIYTHYIYKYYLDPHLTQLLNMTCSRRRSPPSRWSHLRGDQNLYNSLRQFGGVVHRWDFGSGISGMFFF